MSQQAETIEPGGWVPIAWEHTQDAANFEAHMPTIHRMNSPYYEGIRYAVRQGSNTCLNKKGQWEHEPLPSSRTSAFYKRCRFDSFQEAVVAADEARTVLLERYKAMAEHAASKVEPDA